MLPAQASLKIPREWENAQGEVRGESAQAVEVFVSSRIGFSCLDKDRLLMSV